MNHFEDERGALSVIDDRDIPFKIKRVFWITDVPPGATRGEHAHRDCEQLIICLIGSFAVYLNGQKRILYGNGAAYAPAGCYIVLSDFSPGAVCLVLCSEYYEAGDIYRPAAGAGQSNSASLLAGS